MIIIHLILKAEEIRNLNWSKAATEYLAAEVYLWNAKVSVDDNAANEADLAIAKQHCQSLMDNYGLSLMDNYADILMLSIKETVK